MRISNDILLLYLGEQMATKTVGQKAWETRRKNEVSERQRKAALKAWRTRRQNGN